MTYGQKVTVVAVGTVLLAVGLLVSAVSAICQAIEEGSRDVP